MPTYSYKCPSGHYHDEWKSVSEGATDDCPECGQAAKRVVTKAPALDNYHMGLSSSNPTAYEKWGRMQEQKGRKEAKSYRDHGDYGNNYKTWDSRGPKPSGQ